MLTERERERERNRKKYFFFRDRLVDSIEEIACVIIFLNFFTKTYMATMPIN